MVRKFKAVEVIDEFSDGNSEPLAPLVRLAVLDEPLVQPFVKILSGKTLATDVEVANRKLETETDCLLVIVSKIVNRPEVSYPAHT